MLSVASRGDGVATTGLRLEVLSRGGPGIDGGAISRGPASGAAEGTVGMRGPLGTVPGGGGVGAGTTGAGGCAGLGGYGWVAEGTAGGESRRRVVQVAIEVCGGGQMRVGVGRDAADARKILLVRVVPVAEVG